MKTIKGVNIDTEHPDLKKIKTESEVKAAGFFAHLEGDDEKEAIKEFLEGKKVKVVDKEEPKE